MKRRYIALFLAVVVVLGLLFATGCEQKKPGPAPPPGQPGGEPGGQPPADGGKKMVVGVSLMNREQSFYKDLEESLKESAKKNNIELEIRDAEFDSSKQLNGIETLLVKKLDALIICPVDSKAIGSAIKKANKDKIPVFTVDIAAEKGDVVCHIASDNVAGGQKAAQYLAKVLNNKGKIIILDSPQVTSVQERVKGFKEELKKHPDMEIIADVDGGAKQGSAMKTMENMLQAHKEIDGVFAINDETALGALRAVELAKRDNIAIVGYDATPAAREAILKGGPLKADVVQYPKKMAETAIEMVVKYKKGEKVDSKVPVDVGILDKEAIEKAKSAPPPAEGKPGDKVPPPAGGDKGAPPPAVKPGETLPPPTGDTGTPPPAVKPGETIPPPTGDTGTPPPEPKAGEVKPPEGKPGDAKPEGDKPAEVKPEESKPAETKPDETNPDVKEVKPETKPGEEKPDMKKTPM